MSELLVLKAERRDRAGKGAARAVRRTGVVPAVIYGNKQDPELITLQPSRPPFQLRVAGGDNRTCILEVSTNLIRWSPVFTNSTAASGSFDFTEDQSTSAARRFFRATSMS